MSDFNLLLYLPHIGCFQSFFSLGQVEFDLVTGGKGAESFTSNIRIVDKNVPLHSFYLDEAVSLLFIEPLYTTTSHTLSLIHI